MRTWELRRGLEMLDCVRPVSIVSLLRVWDIIRNKMEG